MARFVGMLNGGPGRVIVRKSIPTIPVSDFWPGVPRLKSSLPSGENLCTACPISSTHQTSSDGPIVMPCGRVNIPSPHDPTNVPSRSNIMTGCSPRQNTNARSFESTAMATTSTNDQPAGSVGQPGTATYLSLPLPNVVPALLMTANFPEMFVAADVQGAISDRRRT